MANAIEVMEKHMPNITEKGKAMIDMATSYSITNHTELDHASADLKEIIRLKDYGKSLFDPTIKKAHETHKSAIHLRNQAIAPLEKAEQILRTKIQMFIVDEENKRAHLEEELQKSVEPGSPPPMIPEMPKPEGVSTRNILRLRVTDIVALCEAVVSGHAPREVLIVDESFVKTLVKKRGVENLGLPGIEAYYEPTLVIK